MINEKDWHRAHLDLGSSLKGCLSSHFVVLAGLLGKGMDKPVTFKGVHGKDHCGIGLNLENMCIYAHMCTDNRCQMRIHMMRTQY